MVAWGGQPIGALAGAGLVGTLGIPGTHVIGIAPLALTAVFALRLLGPAAVGDVDDDA